MSIHEKLSKIQIKLKAPKSQYNSFGKYNYRNCEDILEALKPLLNTNKCTIAISDEIQAVGERYYIKALVTLTDIETGETVTTSAYAREDESKKGMDLCQVTGATSSYARKYALNGMFAIDDTKDSDSTNSHGKDKEKPKEYNCVKCGKAFEGFTYNGKTYNAGQAYHIAESKNADGKARCKSCKEKVETEG